MHEKHLTENLVRRIEAIAAAEGGRVTRIDVRLGALSHFTPGHFREHFEDAAVGTLAEGAAVHAELSTDPTAPDAQVSCSRASRSSFQKERSSHERNGKGIRLPVSVRWLTGKRTVATVAGKDDLEVATPPEFKGGVEGVWSPEDLFVGSVASCFAVTLAGIAARRGIPLRGLSVGGDGIVTQRTDGRFGFAEVILHVELATDQGYEREATDAVHDAELGCLVAASVDLPVRVELTVRTSPLVEAA